MSNYLKIAQAAGQNPELELRVEAACAIKGVPYSHDVFRQVLAKQANKLVEVTEVVRIDGAGITDANIDTALGRIFPE